MVIFPDFVQIGAHRYKIIYPHVFKERFDRDGMADHELLEIWISNRDVGGNIKPDTNVLLTFFHELIHCIDTVYLQKAIGKRDDAEAVINGLAEGLTQAYWACAFPQISGNTGSAKEETSCPL